MLFIASRIAIASLHPFHFLSFVFVIWCYSSRRMFLTTLLISSIKQSSQRKDMVQVGGKPSMVDLSHFKALMAPIP